MNTFVIIVFPAIYREMIDIQRKIITDKTKNYTIDDRYNCKNEKGKRNRPSSK